MSDHFTGAPPPASLRTPNTAPHLPAAPRTMVTSSSVSRPYHAAPTSSTTGRAHRANPASHHRSRPSRQAGIHHRRHARACRSTPSPYSQARTTHPPPSLRGCRCAARHARLALETAVPPSIAATVATAVSSHAVLPPQHDAAAAHPVPFHSPQAPRHAPRDALPATKFTRDATLRHELAKTATRAQSTATPQAHPTPICPRRPDRPDALPRLPKRGPAGKASRAILRADKGRSARRGERRRGVASSPP